MTAGFSRTISVIVILALLGLLGAYASHDDHDHAGDECQVCGAVRAYVAPTVTTPVIEPPQPLFQLPSPAQIGRPAPIFPLPWSARAPPQDVSIRL